jgi:hypothetical protein
MVLMASQRTDIPCYYGDWFINRIRLGFLYVRNPFNELQVSKIDLSPEVIDCIVFLSKNPLPFISKLQYLNKYKYCFHFSLTSYGTDIEPNLPNKKEFLISAFKEISDLIGKHKITWRYDPIFINNKYTIEYHTRAFDYIATQLKGYTEKVTISFVDMYKKVIRNTGGFDIKEVSLEQMISLGEKIGKIAKANNMIIETCAEKADLSCVGITHGTCVNKHMIEKITEYPINYKIGKNLRDGCHCMETIEIGTYNTCKNGCIYCYANENQKRVEIDSAKYDVSSPILCSSIGKDDVITTRKCKNLRVNQKSLWKY